MASSAAAVPPSSIDRSSDARSDIVVVGAGVVGLACALALLREGRQVTVLDQGAVGCGSSHGNCGTITPSHAAPLAAPGTLARALRWMLRQDAPLYVPPRWDPKLWGWFLHFARHCNDRDWRATTALKADLLLRSRAALQALVEQENLDCAFASTGLWYVYRDPRALQAMHAELDLLAHSGIASRLLDGAQARAQEPALADSIVGAVEFPGDASLRPDRLVAELARRVRELGGDIREQVQVREVEAQAGGVRIVTASGGDAATAARPATLAAHTLVLACGAWSPLLARRLGIRLPVQPGKGYSITYERPPLAPRRPLVLDERSVCVTAWPDGMRLGSTMEFSGYDSRLNRVRLDALERAAAEYLRVPHGAVRQEQWYGWRPMTFDDLPVIGAHPRVPRVLFATGHGMLGVSLAAITARLLADLVAGRTPQVDAQPLSPQRFERGAAHRAGA